MKKIVFQILAAACISVAISGMALANDDDVNNEAFGEYSDTYNPCDTAIPSDEADFSSDMQQGGEGEEVMNPCDAEPSDQPAETSGESW